MSETTNKVRLDPTKYGYQVNRNFRTSSGRSTIDNGDKVAEVLRGMTLAGVFMVLEANGGEVSPDWEHLNLGMQRMAAGNVLRRIARKLDAEGGTLMVPENAMATIVKVDPAARESAKAEREQKSKEAAEAREALRVEREAKAAEAKAEREQKALAAKTEREQKIAEAKAERERKAEEVKAERERKAEEARAEKARKAEEAEAEKARKAEAAQKVEQEEVTQEAEQPTEGEPGKSRRAKKAA